MKIEGNNENDLLIKHIFQYCEQFYTYKFDNLNEMDKFLEKTQLIKKLENVIDYSQL